MWSLFFKQRLTIWGGISLNWGFLSHLDVCSTVSSHRGYLSCWRPSGLIRCSAVKYPSLDILLSFSRLSSHWFDNFWLLKCFQRKLLLSLNAIKFTSLWWLSDNSRSFRRLERHLLSLSLLRCQFISLPHRYLNEFRKTNPALQVVVVERLEWLGFFNRLSCWSGRGNFTSRA